MPLMAWKKVGKIMENSVLPAFFLFFHFAVFFLPFAAAENAEFFLLLVAIEGILYLPYYRHFIGSLSAQKLYELTIPGQEIDSVSTRGIPYYCDGKFVKYLEN